MRPSLVKVVAPRLQARKDTWKVEYCKILRTRNAHAISLCLYLAFAQRRGATFSVLIAISRTITLETNICARRATAPREKNWKS